MSQQLSFTKIEDMLQCGLKFRYRHLDKLPQAPSPHLSWGRSIHEAIDRGMRTKQSGPPDVDVLIDALYDHWDDEGFRDTPREEKLEWYRSAQDVLRRFHADHAPQFTPPVSTEQFFTFEPAPDITLAGKIDYVQRTHRGGLGVVDWKTNRKAKTLAQVRGSLQLAIYAMACEPLYGVQPDWVALDFVVPGVRVTVPFSEIDLGAARGTILEVAEAIASGNLFTPTPGRLCDWCDFRKLCPAWQGDGPDIPGMAAVELETLERRHAKDAHRIAELKAILERLNADVMMGV